jgi:aspartate/methionine/tyrosine aminotransferase
MQIKPFLTEQFFALYEFTAPHVLASSDCETTSIAELLELSGGSLEEFGEMRLGYTESQGNPEYRRLVTDMYDNVMADDVVILTSPVEGIYLTMQTLLDASDEVIALSPAYDALHHVADHLCGKMQSWDLVPTEAGWEIDFDRLESLVNSNTRLIIVNFPHNPCGYQPSPGEFEQLVEIARRNDCWLFCDEIYRGLEVEWRHEPTLPSAADVYEKAIVLHGLSKTYGLPGLRAGWLIVRDKTIREQLIGWKHYTTICPAAPTEYLSMQALTVRDQLAERSRKIVRDNLRICAEFMKRHSEFLRWRPPTVGSTALVEIDFAQLNGSQTQVFTNATDYCHDLAKKHGVLLLPAACLGCADRFVRIGLGRASFSIALAAWDATLSSNADVSEPLKSR